MNAMVWCVAVVHVACSSRLCERRQERSELDFGFAYQVPRGREFRFKIRGLKRRGHARDDDCYNDDCLEPNRPARACAHVRVRMRRCSQQKHRWARAEIPENNIRNLFAAGIVLCEKK